MSAVATAHCSQCGQLFAPEREAQVVCKPTCAMKKVKADKAAERAILQARKEAIKTIADRMQEAQKAFNDFIRARDAGRPCICCGKPFEADKPGGAVDAGHFISRALAPHLRFTEDNCFAQRKNCNRPGGARHGAFRAGVIARIGLAAVVALEADETPRKWMHQELIAVRALYVGKLKELKKGTGA